MTRVNIKKPQSGSQTSTIVPANNMSTEDRQSMPTPSAIPISTSRISDSKEKLDSSRRDVSASHLNQNEPSDPAVPVPSQPPANLEKTSERPTPIPSHGDLKAPSLAHKARLRIHFEDLTHPAVAKFLEVMPISSLLQTAITNVQEHLFTPSKPHHSPSKPHPHPHPDPPQTTPNPTAVFSINNTVRTTSLAYDLPQPLPPPQHPLPPPKPDNWPPQEVRSVTLIIRSMSGVAYTTGTDLDESHKEIHLNIGYLESTLKNLSSKPKHEADALFRYELMGVVTHEMVHVFQHNAHGTCPGGLVEGIADYVRLKSGLGAKHWNPWPAEKDTRGEKWDEGYQKTAWFLVWVEEEVETVGSGLKDVIARLNNEMRRRKWDDGKVWKDVVGVSVEKMWKRYTDAWEEMNKKHEKEEKGKGGESEE